VESEDEDEVKVEDGVELPPGKEGTDDDRDNGSEVGSDMVTVEDEEDNSVGVEVETTGLASSVKDMVPFSSGSATDARGESMFFKI